MAEHRPIVLINGELQQLPIGDTIAGATSTSGGGGTAVERDADKAHLYWRIHIPSGQGFFDHALAGLQFHETETGPNLCTGGTPFAYGGYGTIYPPANAFDASLTTWWAFDASQAGQYGVGMGNIGYQFPTPVKVGHVKITARDSVDAAKQAPRYFTLQYSDNGLIYHDAHSFGTQTDYALSETRSFTRPVA